MRNIIQIHEEDLFELIEQVVERLREKYDVPLERWIDGAEAMSLLQISSKTTLLRFRNEGLIRYSQPTKKVILYDRLSIEKFIDSNAKETF